MRLAFSVSGEGPPLVLVHGWGLGPRAWDGILPRLAERFTVHVVSLPGYGQSAPAVNATLEELADTLIASLPAPVTLCGWSLGAMLALTCAVRHPAQIRKLVLVGANASFVRRDDWPEALAAEQLADFERQVEGDAAGLLRDFCGLINHGDGQAREATRVLRCCLDDGLPAHAASLRAGLELLRTTDLRPIAGPMQQPTLLLHGSTDPLMPLAGARRLAARLAAPVEVFDGAAHAPFASRPAEFIERIFGFAGVSA